jgi:hypothetical protein
MHNSMLHGILTTAFIHFIHNVSICSYTA